MKTFFPQDRNAFLVHTLGHFGRSGVCKTRSSALPTVRVEGKLAHDQDLTTDVRQRKIHFFFSVLENAQTDHFVQKGVPIRIGIDCGNPKKDKNTKADFPDDFTIHPHRRGRNPLNTRTHGKKM